jgi:hypothetical protein
VDLRFVTPELARLDEIDGEVLACTVWSDIRPSHGVAGLCDFRLGGRISDLERRGLVRGTLGETVLVPGRPRLSFDKIVIFGAGSRASFGEVAFRSVVQRMLGVMEGLLARVAVVELPGRHDDLVPAERAADILLDCAARKPEHDAWTLVEKQDGKQRIVQHMIEERRRVRRVF